MIKKKVCLIGAYAVGKTSLVRQFVSGIFSENYLTTVGVKIDQRTLTIQNQQVRLMIWDIAGRDEFQTVRQSYLHGASGFLYVADATRKETLDAVLEEHQAITKHYPSLPTLLLINKSDLQQEKEIHDSDLQFFHELGIKTAYTSAMTGEQVAESFEKLATQMCQLNPPPQK